MGSFPKVSIMDSIMFEAQRHGRVSFYMVSHLHAWQPSQLLSYSGCCTCKLTS